MIVYHLTFGKSRANSILRQGLLPGRDRVLAESYEETSGKIFFGRSPEESREQLNLIDHPIEGDEILLTVDLPEGYKLSTDEWGYLYGTQKVSPKRIIGRTNITQLLERFQRDRRRRTTTDG